MNIANKILNSIGDNLFYEKVKTANISYQNFIRRIKNLLTEKVIMLKNRQRKDLILINHVANSKKEKFTFHITLVQTDFFVR